MNKLKTVLVLTTLVISILCDAQNNEWMQFRGPNASGIAPENAKPPVEFSQDKNILWKTSIPSGVSSPCICGSNIFITGVDIENKKYLVWNINRMDGSLKWQREIAVDTFQYVHSVSSPAAATPSSDGEYLYIYIPAYGIVNFDFDGNQKWKYPLDFCQVKYGSGTSPIVVQDKIILNRACQGNAKLIAINKINGTLIWEKKLSSPTNFSTPVVWNEQIILHQRVEVTSFDIRSGNEVWKFNMPTTGTATPVIMNDILYINGWIHLGEKALFGDIDDMAKIFNEYDNNQDGLLTKEEFPDGLVAAERPEATDMESSVIKLEWEKVGAFDIDKNNEFTAAEWKRVVAYFERLKGHGLVAVQLGDTGNISSSALLWKVGENIPETPSVLCKNGLLYMIKNGGLITCVNAKTGETSYKGKLGASGAYFSSPLYANGNIYIASYNGVITVFKEGRNLEVVSRNDLNERILASPVAIEDKLYIRTEKNLYAFKE